ncbi:MAG TPA: hypothetical protein PLP17_14600, partial [Oligoflexia bacterium]|nr:hypothetical protein [Oligoflexia bacterium]
HSGLPHGSLVQALEIVRDNDRQSLSLSVKLQRALPWPFRTSWRKAEINRERLGKLKAPEGLTGTGFCPLPPDKPQ